MGRIKQAMVKRATFELLKNKDIAFSPDFVEDKRLLGNNTMPSKKVRNKVAGYIARLKKAELKAAK